MEDIEENLTPLGSMYEIIKNSKPDDNSEYWVSDENDLIPVIMGTLPSVKMPLPVTMKIVGNPILLPYQIVIADFILMWNFFNRFSEYSNGLLSTWTNDLEKEKSLFQKLIVESKKVNEGGDNKFRDEIVKEYRTHFLNYQFSTQSIDNSKACVTVFFKSSKDLTEKGIDLDNKKWTGLLNVILLNLFGGQLNNIGVIGIAFNVEAVVQNACVYHGIKICFYLNTDNTTDYIKVATDFKTTYFGRDNKFFTFLACEKHSILKTMVLSYPKENKIIKTDTPKVINSSFKKTQTLPATQKHVEFAPKKSLGRFDILSDES